MVRQHSCGSDDRGCWWSVILAAVFLGLAGCGGGSEPVMVVLADEGDGFGTDSGDVHLGEESLDRSDADEEPADSGAGDTTDECRNNLDCQPGHACEQVSHLEEGRLLVERTCVLALEALSDVAGAVSGEQCGMDADCAAGLWCRLNRCAATCTADAECPDQATCSPRGQCIDLDANMAVLALERAVAVVVEPSLVTIPIHQTAAAFDLVFSGLQPGAEVAWRLEVAGGSDAPSIRIPSSAQEGVVVGPAGGGPVRVRVEVQRSTAVGSTDAARLRLVTEAGTYLFDVLAQSSIHGTYSGAVNFRLPVQFITVPIEFEVWPAATGGGDWVVLRERRNVLFSRDHVLPAVWDPANRRLQFNLITALDGESWQELDRDTYRTRVNALAPVVPDPLNAEVLARIADWTRFELLSQQNPLRTPVARQLSVVVTVSDGLDFAGEYLERWRGLTQNTVSVRADVGVARVETLDELRARGTAPPAAITPQLVPGDLRDRPAVSLAQAESDLGLEICRTLALPVCNGLTPASSTEAILACAEGALRESIPLFGATALSSLERYTEGYASCTGGGTSTGAGAPQADNRPRPPAVAATGCIDEAAARCSLAGYAAVINRGAPGAAAAEAWMGLMDLQRQTVDFYTFLANEYEMFAVQNAVLGEGASIDNEVRALRFAANARYLAASAALQPWYVDLLPLYPSALSGASSSDLTEALRRNLYAQTEASRAMLSTLNQLLRREYRAAWNPNPEDAGNRRAVGDIGYALLMTTTVMATLGTQSRARFGAQVDEATLLNDLRTPAADLLRHYRDREAGTRPFGLGNAALRLPLRVDESRGVFRTLLDAETSGAIDQSLTQAERSYTAFVTAENELRTGAADLEDALAQTIAGFNSQLHGICPLAPPVHPLWEAGRPRVGNISAGAWAAYEVAVNDWLGACVDGASGPLAELRNEIVQAELRESIAFERIEQVYERIRIADGRVRRLDATARRYLRFRIGVQREVTARELAEFDLQSEVIKREARSRRRKARKGIIGGVVSFVTAVAAKKPEGAVSSLIGIANSADELSQVSGDQRFQLEQVRRRQELAAERAELQERLVMSAVHEAQDVRWIELQAEQRRELVTMQELRIQLLLAEEQSDLAELRFVNRVSDLMRLLNERDVAIDRWSQRGSNPFRDPAFRLMRDASERAFARRMDQALESADALLAALEYELGADSDLRRQLYRVTTPATLGAFYADLARVYDCFEQTVRTTGGARRAVRLRRDVMGIARGVVDEVTGETVSAGELFRRELFGPNNLPQTGLLRYRFSIGLAASPVSGYFMSSSDVCNEVIQGVEAIVVGDDLGTARVQMSLIQDEGASYVRTCESRLFQDPSNGLLDRLRSFTLTSTRSTLEAGVNQRLTDGRLAQELAGRPAACGDWVIEIRRDAVASNRDLRFENIEDIILLFDTQYRTIQPSYSAEICYARFNQ
jgi:hypothetical protein